MFATYKITRFFTDKSQEKLRRELRVEKIKNDTLTKIKEGLYTKLVADTLTKRELRQKVDSLKLEIKDPKIIFLFRDPVERLK